MNEYQRIYRARGECAFQMLNDLRRHSGRYCGRPLDHNGRHVSRYTLWARKPAAS